MENVGEACRDFMGDVAEEAIVEATEPSLDLDLTSDSCPAPGRANLG